MKGKTNITIGFLPQATGNYGAECGFVKYLAHNFTLFSPISPLKYDTIADDFSPYILAGDKFALELGKFGPNGGNSTMKLGNFTVNGGNSVPYRNREKP
jgi:hypothetical protein